MCTCSLIALWCPCETHEYTIPTPGRGTRHGFPQDECEGHTITKLINTGAYIWCDDFLQSPTFANDFHSKPPNCPNNELKYEYLHFPSRTFCADCLSDGCSTVREQENKYGYAHPWDRRAAKRAYSKKQAAAREAGVKAEKARRASMSAPLRVINLREDDESDINRIKREALRAATVPLRIISFDEDDEADIDRIKATVPLRIIDFREEDEAYMDRSIALRARGVSEREAWEGWMAAKEDMRRWDIEELLKDLYAAFVVDGEPAGRGGLWGNAKRVASDSETDSDDDDDTASVSTVVPARSRDQRRRRRNHHHHQHKPGVQASVRCSVLHAPCRRRPFQTRDRLRPSQADWLGPVRIWAELGRRWGRSMAGGRS